MLRDPRIQKILLTVAGSAIVLWTFFLADLLPFGYKRVAQQKAELQVEYEGLERELEKARRMVDELPQLEREQRELEEKWKQAEALLPNDREVPELLTQITQAGDQSGVAFELFKPSGVRPKEFYNENPVEVQVTAGYHQLGMFLSRLANLARLVNVERLQLVGKEQRRPDKETKKTNIMQKPNLDHTLTASFLATAYSLQEGGSVGNAVTAEPGVEQPLNKGKARRAAPARQGGGSH